MSKKQTYFIKSLMGKDIPIGNLFITQRGANIAGDAVIQNLTPLASAESIGWIECTPSVQVKAPANVFDDLVQDPVDTSDYATIGSNGDYPSFLEAFFNGEQKFKFLEDEELSRTGAAQIQTAGDLVIDPVAKTITADGVRDWIATGWGNAKVISIFESAVIVGNEIGADQIHCTVEVLNVTSTVITYGRVIGDIRANTANNGMLIIEGYAVRQDRPLFLTAKDKETGILLGDNDTPFVTVDADQTGDALEVFQSLGIKTPGGLSDIGPLSITNYLEPDGVNVTDFTVTAPTLQVGDYLQIQSADAVNIPVKVAAIEPTKITLDKYYPLKRFTTQNFTRIKRHAVHVGTEGLNTNNMKIANAGGGGNYLFNTGLIHFFDRRVKGLLLDDVRFGYDEYGFGTVMEDCVQQSTLGNPTWARIGYVGEGAIFRRCTFTYNQDRVFQYTSIYEDCIFPISFDTLYTQNPYTAGRSVIFKDCTFHGRPPHFGRIIGGKFPNGISNTFESPMASYSFLTGGALLVQNGVIIAAGD